MDESRQAPGGPGTGERPGEAPTPGRVSVDQVRSLLNRWVHEGLLGRETADSILSAEWAWRAEALEPGDRMRGRVPAVTEVLAYLGGTLVLVAVFTFVAMSWRDLGTPARFALLALAAVGLGAPGLVVLRGGDGDDDPVRRRLASFLWALAAVAAGGVLAVVAQGPFDADVETVLTVLGAGASVAAFLAWRRLPTPLLQAVLFGAVAMGALSALAHVDEVDETALGLLLYALGGLWFGLAWAGRLAPRRTGLAVGAVAAGVGAQMFAAQDVTASVLLGVVTGLALLWLGVVRREPLLTGLGVVGILFFLPQFVFRAFGEAVGAPLALFLAGLVVLGVSLWISRVRRSQDGSSLS